MDIETKLELIKRPPTEEIITEQELREFKQHIDRLTDSHASERITEPEIREKAYKILIPFLSSHARANVQACREAVNYFESKMKLLEPHFKKLRNQIIEERRKIFLQKINAAKSQED